jgi:hypothetical protein
VSTQRTGFSYTSQDSFKDKDMKTFFTGLVASLALLFALAGISCGALQLLETLGPVIGDFHHAANAPVAYILCVVALVHLIGVQYFSSGLPHPWECTRRDIGVGLLLGATALLFTVAGPLFAHVASDAYAQLLAQVVGVAYGVLMGGLLLSLFLALACWELAEKLTDLIWELGYLASTAAR